MLADAGDDRRLAPRLLGQGLHQPGAGHARPLIDVVGWVIGLDRVDLGAPLRVRARLNSRQQAQQRLAHVAVDRRVGVEVFADFGRVDVDVDDSRGGVEVLETPHRAVVEAHPDADHDIGAIGRHVGVEVAVHAQEAERERVVVGEAGDAQQGGEHGDVGLLRELAQLVRAARLHHPVPGDDDRLLRAVDHVGGDGHLIVARDVHNRIAAQADIGGVAVPLRFLDEDILGDVHQHGALTPGRGDVEGLFDRLGDLAGAHQQVVVLGDRQGDAGDVGFLEAVASDQVAGDIAGDRDDGDGVHLRGGDAGDEVGRAGSGGGEADAGASGDAGVAVGGVRGGLFVAHEHVLDVGVVAELVVERQDNAAGVAEEDINALGSEAFHQDFSAGESHRFSFRCCALGVEIQEAPAPGPAQGSDTPLNRRQPPVGAAEPRATATRMPFNCAAGIVPSV